MPFESEYRNRARQLADSFREARTGKKPNSQCQTEVEAEPASLCSSPGEVGANSEIKDETANQPPEHQSAISKLGRTIEVETDVPAIPQSVFGALPRVLRETVILFRSWYEKDAFLTGALACISACLWNYVIQYGKREHYANLYAFIIAPAASGKGGLSHAVELIEPIDSVLCQESIERRQAWKDAKREHPDDDHGPEPPIQCLIAGEDTTKAMLCQRLEQNYGILVFSTEGDALSSANESQHGDFSPVFRRSYHHELVAVDRKGSPSLRIQCPRLSLALAGTPEQFGRLVKNVEDGWFSRFIIYKYEAPLVYESQRPVPQDIAFQKAIKSAQGTIFRMFVDLRNRTSLLRYEVSEDLWTIVDKAFKSLFDHLFGGAEETEEGSVNRANPILAASIKRGALNTFRIAMILSALRAVDENVDLGKVDVLVATPEDIKTAVSLGQVYTEHALRMPKNVNLPDMNDVGVQLRMTGNQRRLYDSLPVDFTTAQAEEVAQRIQVPRPTLFRWLSKFVTIGILQRSAHGYYQKACG